MNQIKSMSPKALKVLHYAYTLNPHYQIHTEWDSMLFLKAGAAISMNSPL